MSRKTQFFRRNLLIICEGEVTEPEYFALLRKKAIDDGIWEEIKIRPKPRSEESVPPSKRSPHKSARPKRKLKPGTVKDKIDPVEKKYNIKSQPTCWIKEARDTLKEESFEEIWVVFDDDGRSIKNEEAFQLALESVNGQIVHIAFSSIAFEHWILLHFERNASAFKKSLCRTGDKLHDCGSSMSTDDCGGAHCLIGYMRHKHYLPTDSSTKKTEKLAKILRYLNEQNNRQIAYTNAAWLRHIVQHDLLKPYTVNPFTNVDILVQRLLGEEQEITWGRFDQYIPWHEIEIRASISNKRLLIQFNNLSKASLLVNGIDVAVLISTDTIHFNPHPQTVIIGPQEQKEITESITESEEVLLQIRYRGAKLIIG